MSEVAKPRADMRTPMSRVYGLGSAKAGTDHFIGQRVTAIALVPLVLIFLVGLITHAGAGYEEVRGWIASPMGAAPLLLLLLAGFYHMRLGMQVVIEDYIHSESLKLALLLANTFWAVAAGVACLWAVLKISFGA